VDLPARADVAIVGAGYTGLSAGRELARRGASVVVLDAERVGFGASSRNGGQVLTGLKLDSSTLLARYGERRARELFDISIESIEALERLIEQEQLDCEYHRSGHLDAANKPSDFKAFQEEQSLLDRVYHHRVEVISRGDQSSEIGSSAYYGVMLDERSGALNPAMYVQQLAAAACRAGAVIAEAARVTDLRRANILWEVTTTRGSFEARDVLVATNGYTDRAAKWLQRRLVPIGSYIIATEPLSDADARQVLPKRRMVFDANYFLHYFRLSRDNRLLFGGRARFTPSTADSTQRCAEILRRDMLLVFPALASVKIDYAWSGNVAFTRDQLPHGGRLDQAYYSAGYCGHGVAMATYLGALMARRIAGDHFDHPLIDAHFPAIPLYDGKPWFLPIAAAYYKLRDWIR
jgi:glycine/D-amino acid oxidase-like deaminating enzyme